MVKVYYSRSKEQFPETTECQTKCALRYVLTCCRPLRSICFQNWKSKQRSLQYLQTREAHRQRSFTVKWESTCKDAKGERMHKDKPFNNNSQLSSGLVF